MKTLIRSALLAILGCMIAVGELEFFGVANAQAREDNWMATRVIDRVHERNMRALSPASRGAMGPQMKAILESRIVGGGPAGTGQNPFQAALVMASISDNASAQFCGGTLVHPNYVVTAAHCSDFVTADQVQVLVGTQRLDGSGTRFDVNEIVIHPDWNSTTFDNDVAVWRLDGTAGGMPLAALGSEDGPVGADLLATGWGRLTQGGTAPIDLNAVEVPLVDRANCNDANSYNGEITDNMICAGFDAGGKDSCQGDSGGPLTRGPDNTLLTGITSWGFGCAQPNLFGVYTRVSSPKISDFIRNLIGGSLYQLHNNGTIWRYTGQSCTGSSCPGWQKLDNNPRTAEIAATGGTLYQRHNDGAIWQHTGQACSGNSCPGWVKLDNNPRTAEITAAGGTLYQRHNDGAIWQHTGQVCSGNSCPGWVKLDNNPRSAAIGASGDQLYQLHNNGAIWRFTGQACSGNSCPGWERLDGNPRTTAITSD